MRTKRLIPFFLAITLLLSTSQLIAQSPNGGKPKRVINGSISSGSTSKQAKKTTNIHKKSVFRKSMSMLTATPPAGAREKKQNKTHNQPKKYLRF